VKLARKPSDYIRDNIVVTTSGMCAADPLICAISALGPDHVMFAADYPFESAQEAAHFIDGAPLDEKVRAAICFDNAARLLRLPKP
jgi:2,3-dihydroxybenzoate decarboxylase